MKLRCPRCKVGRLEEIEINNILIDRCNICAGLWFDLGEIEALAGQIEKIKEIDPDIPPDSAINDEMPCPRCDGVMLRKHEITSELYTYRCASCMGTWIDRGQLKFAEDKNIEKSIKEILNRKF
jgi:Zn-finger nucleic acid-binding protein